MEIFIITILTILVIFLTYFLRRQILLNEKFIENMIFTENIISNLDQIVDEISMKLDIIDTKGSFKSDDEIGFFFTDVQQLHQILVDYKNI